MRRSLCPLIYLLWRTGRISPCWDVWPRDPRTSVSWSGLCYNQINSPEPVVSPGEHVWGVFRNSRMMVISSCVRLCTVWQFLPSHVCFFSETRRDKKSIPSYFWHSLWDKSPCVCFIEKHKQNFIDILLFMEALFLSQGWKNKIIAFFLNHKCFAMVNSYLIVYCAITCYILS